jgi:hypothetical protein
MRESGNRGSLGGARPAIPVSNFRWKRGRAGRARDQNYIFDRLYFSRRPPFPLPARPGGQPAPFLLIRVTAILRALNFP